MLQIMIACRRTGLAFAFVRERTLGSLISCKLGYKLPPALPGVGNSAARCPISEGEGPRSELSGAGT